MKRIFTLAIVAILASTQLSAQRYLEEIFDDVEVTTDVQYGVNATVLALPLLGEAIPENLLMDVYEPAGDTETERPLILYFHTGNFLPHPENGSTSGLRTDSATVEICTRFAKMGYVVASCDYRLGWNPLAETQDERVFTLINAAYRGVQDARTAARFFRMEAAENGNPWGIDVDRFVVWGQGTGGYISLAASTIDEYSDIVLPKFTLDVDGMPVPMVIEAFNGDITGESFGVFEGDTLCYINHPGYDSGFQMNVNMGGALGDISWLDDGDGPFVSFQAPTDPFAPYTEGILIVPQVNLPVVEVQGAYLVQQLCDLQGNNAIFADAELDDVFSQAANANNDGYDGLYPFVRPAGAEADSSPWDFWADTNPNNANGLLTNPDMTPEKGRTFIDTIQAYAAPRMACALMLPENPCAAAGPQNDECDFSVDVNDLFGAAVDQTQVSDMYSNADASAEDDLNVGYDCFEDNNNDAPSIENTVWFEFEGDGQNYVISTSDCDGTATFFEGDTQMAIYSGSCMDLEPVACNEDIDFDGGDYYSSIELETMDGTTYYIMVDGYDYTAFGGDPAVGDFCLEVTQTIVSVEELNAIGLSVFPNPANEVLNVTAAEQITSIEVFNVAGQLIESINPQNLRVEMDLTTWETGIYVIHVSTKNGKAVQRFVKK